MEGGVMKDTELAVLITLTVLANLSAVLAVLIV